MVRPEEGELSPFKQFVFDQRWLVRQLVEDTRFNQAFLGITILNTLFLALAYDGTATVILLSCVLLHSVNMMFQSVLALAHVLFCTVTV